MNTQSTHVVYVEDDPDIRDLFTEELQACGFQVKAFEKGPEALAFIKSAPANQSACVISDFRMPGMNGGELLEALIEEGYKRPFILLSGDIESQEDMRQKAKGIHFELVSKPCSIVELRAAVERALNQKIG